jgi:hypothetical protein
MLVDEFWDLVESARSDAGVAGGRFDVDAVAVALQTRIEALPLERIIDFYYRYHEVRGRLDQWEMCAATYLISGYLSDSALEDFQAGVIALGRAAFEWVAENPDELSENPVVIDIAAGRLERLALFGERIELAAAFAYDARGNGEEDAFWDAIDERAAASGGYPLEGDSWDGRFGEPEDRELMPTRLPRLAAMFGHSEHVTR